MGHIMTMYDMYVVLWECYEWEHSDKPEPETKPTPLVFMMGLSLIPCVKYKSSSSPYFLVFMTQVWNQEMLWSSILVKMGKGNGSETMTSSCRDRSDSHVDASYQILSPLSHSHPVEYLSHAHRGEKIRGSGMGSGEQQASTIPLKQTAASLLATSS